ncbi:hypothetical protein A7K91_09955 [Paenibacillus oryzae]|uniref:Uncharacterized protein n=1 Tax=Paenibacillus oryzae TaxID=1844972 RepID=A0A1A5YSB4_9BACL|nr:hypothetical protein A7K91_09955 [Paenibacillus oryzae]
MTEGVVTMVSNYDEVPTAAHIGLWLQSAHWNAGETKTFFPLCALRTMVKLLLSMYLEVCFEVVSLEAGSFLRTFLTFKSLFLWNVSL